MSLLILVRHGQSKWNAKNRFTGWVDVPLSEKGIQEAIDAGNAIADMPIDSIFTSTLTRARMTMSLMMAHHSSGKVPCFQHPEDHKLNEWGKIYSDEAIAETIPVEMAWELNERMYGELQGQNKDEMRAKYGEEQVHIWRRSYDVAPPGGESLAMTAERTIPYFKKEIVKKLSEGNNVLVSAHGNSLRAIVMDIEGLSREEVLKLEIPTGIPLFYNFKDGKFEKHLP